MRVAVRRSRASARDSRHGLKPVPSVLQGYRNRSRLAVQAMGAWTTRLRAAASVWRSRLTWSGGSPWRRGVIVVVLLACGVVTSATTAFVLSALYAIHFDRDNLPDPGPFTRFEFPTIGHVYDADGQPLIELAREYRRITPYADIPPVVRDAILATEDKRFFTHNGVDYLSIPRMIWKVRIGAWLKRLSTGRRSENTRGPAIFPQGGSTITQQLVRGVFLQDETARENGQELQTAGILPRLLAVAIGARNVNMAHPKARRDPAVDVDRRADARAIRIEAQGEGRDPRPLCQLCLHG